MTSPIPIGPVFPAAYPFFTDDYITVPNAKSYGTFPHHVPASQVDWNLANWTCQHLWMIEPRILNDMINKTFALREMNCTFETKIRQDAEYSTYIVQRPS